MYGSEKERLAAVCEFFRTGLLAAELIIHVTGADAMSVNAYLAEGGVDCDEAFERRQIRVITVVDADSGGASRVGEVVDQLTSIRQERESRVVGVCGGP